MLNDELLIQLKEIFPEQTIEQGADWPEMVLTDSSVLVSLVGRLKSGNEFLFDYLFCETCIDWKTHLTLVYHLASTRYKHSMVVKVKLDSANPVVDSMYPLYKTAEFHEREIFDLFGVTFTNHPDLRRLLLTDDWKGHPLRKDYEDPINMIRL